MKTFTKEFMIANKGCYSEKMVIDLYFLKGNSEILSQDILDSEIKIKDKYWFFCKKVFTNDQNKQIAIRVAEAVLPIYEARYANNKAPRNAIQAAKDYIAGKITIEELYTARRAAGYDGPGSN